MLFRQCRLRHFTVFVRVLADFTASQIVLEWVHVRREFGNLAEPDNEKDIKDKTEDVQTSDNGRSNEDCEDHDVGLPILVKV